MCPGHISPDYCVRIQGLEGVIGMSAVHPTWKQTRPGKDDHRGWAFAWPGTLLIVVQAASHRHLEPGFFLTRVCLFPVILHAI